MDGIISLPEGLPESSSSYEISDSIDVSVDVDSVVFCVPPVLFRAFFSFFDLPKNDMNIALKLTFRTEVGIK